jgi:hypothetical protein
MRRRLVEVDPVECVLGLGPNLADGGMRGRCRSRKSPERMGGCPRMITRILESWMAEHSRIRARFEDGPLQVTPGDTNHA